MVFALSIIMVAWGASPTTCGSAARLTSGRNPRSSRRADTASAPSESHPAQAFCALALESKPLYSPVMQAHRAETTLSEDGVITLRDIPFRRGESVEVIVLPFAPTATSGSRYPLRGTPVTLLAPTEPVAEADWEAAG